MRTVAEQLAGKAAVIQVNTEENRLLATRFGVRGIPLTVLIRNARAVAQLNGAQSSDALLTWFRRHAT